MTPLPSTSTEPKADLLPHGALSADLKETLRKVVTQVKAADGRIEEFDPERLCVTMYRALRRTQVNDITVLQSLVSKVVTSLNRHFNGNLVPTAEEIKDAVIETLLTEGYTGAARWYLIERQRYAWPPRNAAGAGRGITVRRVFTTAGAHPFDSIPWERRDAVITSEKGEVVFEQKGVEVPAFWSQSATNIVVSKYFRGRIGTPEREWSVKQMVTRVARTIANWGRAQGYFRTAEDGDAFEFELTHTLVNQHAAFNSPVWFNVGVSEFPQCSACFINSVRDDMRSILNLAVTEGMLFKYGSGTGSNLSTLRSSREQLGGSSGRSSGPVSFMKGFDSFAGVIKSGGKTRRAAKMVILNVDHPDVLDFIQSKAREEKKAYALIDAGYEAAFNSDSWNSAYGSIAFQNANHSVRVTDAFMEAYLGGRPWQLTSVTTGQTAAEMPASEIMRQIADAAWQCGDPGMQYDTTINTWNPCSKSARINASNPCSEYMFLDDTACNLASINLMKCRTAEGAVDVELFKHICEIIITAQEIVVDNSSYPTPAIERNSYDFRPLGIGYANLGALLMARGIPYDSVEGRNIAAAITSLLSGWCYRQSAKIAREIGPFNRYKENEMPFLNVITMHRDAAYAIPEAGVHPTLAEAARTAWDEALVCGGEYGFRNAQISVIAPTGTIAFLMDCDTTGIEPDIALVKYKWLVGGGLMKLVNNTVRESLLHLGYADDACRAILDYIDKNDTIEGAPHLKDEHLPVFDCAFKPANGQRSIHYMGHVRMMAAVQPFVSGAISKTVNMPEATTVEDIMGTYVEAWKLGLKAIAIYRDGCKRSQPLTTSKDQSSSSVQTTATATENTASVAHIPHGVPSEPVFTPRRRRLSDERRSLTHKFSIGQHEGYITVGLYDDGTPGEIFITMAKEGSVISGLMDAFATSTSIGLQYGVPLKVLVDKFSHMRFEPAGYTGNPQIRIAKSIVDYVFRWLGSKFLAEEEQERLGIHAPEGPMPQASAPIGAQRPPQLPFDASGIREAASPLTSPSGVHALTATFNNSADAPACDSCGALMVRYAACYRCINCGSTTGCS